MHHAIRTPSLDRRALAALVALLALLGTQVATASAAPAARGSAWGSIALAVRGVKAGAANFFTKPWDNAQLIALIACVASRSSAAPNA